MTLLLVTACSVDEVEILFRLEQVDIVDLKNVREDESLGCPTLDLIEYAIKIRPRGKLVSVPIGDLQTYTSNVRLCVQVLDRLGVDFVKIGLAVKSADSVNKILKAVREVSMSCKIVPACFADWKVYKLVSPLYVLEQTRKLDFEYFMIDTKDKHSGKTLLDYITVDELRKIVEYAHDHGIKVAIAGKLNLDIIRKLLEIVNVDIIGVRSAVCQGGRTGKISPELVREVGELIKSSSKFLNKH